MVTRRRIPIEVAWDDGDGGCVLALTVEPGTTAYQAICAAGVSLAARESLELGVFGRLVANDYVVESGDRVEVYRALKVDPKDARRRRARLARDR